jgi:hypothetical protein
MSNMKEIVNVMWYYKDVNGSLPADILDKQGRPLLSWRVKLLPFIDRDGLFKKFRLGEPWDSPHNRCQTSTDLARQVLERALRTGWRNLTEEQEGSRMTRQPIPHNGLEALERP